MDSTVREGPGFSGKPLGEKLKLVVLFLIITAVVYLSHPHRTLLIAGLAVTLLGVGVRVWAAGHLTRDQKLTTTGPYRFTRNPFYLGRFLILIGFALLSGLSNPWVWAVFACCLAFFLFVYMPRKEKREGGRLERLFGDDYRDWRQNVPALLPRVTPYGGRDRRWSSQLFFAGDADFSGNKELTTTIVTLLIAALFCLRFLTQTTAS